MTADRFVDPELGCSYRYILSDTEYFRPHYHDYFEIFIMLDGSARHLVGDARIPLRTGDMVFIRPRDTHDYISRDGNPFSMLNITFSASTAQSIFSFLGDGFPSRALLTEKLPPAVHFSTAELTAFRSRMAAISAMDSSNTPLLKTTLRVLLFDIFTKNFADFATNVSTVPLWLDSLCSEFRKAGGFTEGSEKLFAMTGKSREHVCRSMKKYMGVTVTEFVNDLRLNYICTMLRSSNHTITEIIYESGFNNLSWAAEQFKLRYGMTMRQYRNS